MSHAAALNSLHALEGEDLLKLGRANGIIARGQDQLDKGWANRVVRAVVGPGPGADIRVVALRASTGQPKHALALASLDAENIVFTPFSRSPLRAAMDNMLLVAREDESATGDRRRSRILGVSRFSVTEAGFIARQVERDYETIRRAVIRGEELHGGLGELVQVRTKGTGGPDTPRTYAFYCRSAFVARMLGLG